MAKTIPDRPVRATDLVVRMQHLACLAAKEHNTTEEKQASDFPQSEKIFSY